MNTFFVFKASQLAFKLTVELSIVSYNALGVIVVELFITLIR